MASTKKVLHLIVTHAYFVGNIAEITGGKYGEIDYCSITAVAYKGKKYELVLERSSEHLKGIPGLV